MFSVLRNFAKFTRKHLRQSLFFNEEALAQVFSCEFCEITKNTFSYRTSPVAASAYDTMRTNKNLSVGREANVNTLKQVVNNPEPWKRLTIMSNLEGWRQNLNAYLKSCVYQPSGYFYYGMQKLFSTLFHCWKIRLKITPQIKTHQNDTWKRYVRFHDLWCNFSKKD